MGCTGRTKTHPPQKKRIPLPNSGKNTHRTRTWIHDTLNACISFTFDFMLFGGCERRRQDGNGLTDVNNESEINVLNFPRAHNYLLFLLMFAVYASVRS